MKNPRWMYGFWGLIGFGGIPSIINGNWWGAIWVVWFIWFIYFFTPYPFGLGKKI